MLRKGSLVAIICVAVVAASLVFLQEKHSTYAKKPTGEVTFTGINFSSDTSKQKFDKALGNIIGINKYELDPGHKSVTVFFDDKIMQPEWIEKSLESDGFKAKIH